MGLQYGYFTAEDDEAAAAFMLAAWPPLREDIRLDDLAELEELLTDRSVQDTMADRRFGAEIAEQVDEDAGVAECGVVAVTDTLTRALAVADPSTLPATWYVPVDTLRELAVVARHAVTHGHHMYCLWVV